MWFVFAYVLMSALATLNFPRKPPWWSLFLSVLVWLPMILFSNRIHAGCFPDILILGKIFHYAALEDGFCIKWLSQHITDNGNIMLKVKNKNISSINSCSINTFSKSTLEILEKVWNMFKIKTKDTRTTSMAPFWCL